MSGELDVDEAIALDDYLLGHIDPDDYLSDCELEEQASKAEDAYARYVLAWDDDGV